MDKNTLNGLLLMAAVFLLFMWLSPKGNKEDDKNESSTPATEQVMANTTDRLSDTELEWLVNNISNNGAVTLLPDSSRVTRLSQAGVDLSLKGDSIFGTVTVNGRQLDWNDLCRVDLSKMSANEQKAAVEIVRNLSTNMGK